MKSNTKSLTSHGADGMFSVKARCRITYAILSIFWLTQSCMGLGSMAIAQSIGAGPIADPRAPVAFQPAIINTPGHAPVVNITAPNNAGLSLNRYERFDVPGNGVVLNNSQIGGRPLVGGTASANPNLVGGKPANTIVNEVTVTGSSSQINGTVEVFGTPASVIIANPNGITCNGCGVVNTPRLSFSTGSITLQDVNGASSAFDLASGVGFSVSGGKISIEGNGVEGTVGQLDLIGEQLYINGPLRAHYLNQGVSSINLTAGKTNSSQSTSTDSTATNRTPIVGTAIDATALGAMTAGRITVLSTDAGMGVNLRGPLLAYQKDVDIRSAGRVTTGDVAASRDIRISADGTVITGGVVAANEKVQVSGRDGVSLNGEVSARGDITLDSEHGSISSRSTLVTTGNLDMTAGKAIGLGSQSVTQVAGATTMTAQSVVMTGQLASGKDLDVRAQDSVGIAGTTVVGGNLSVNAGDGASLLGNLQVNQSARVSANDVHVAGNTVVGKDLTLDGGDSVSLSGRTLVGNELDVSGDSVAIAGDIDAGDTRVDAGNLTLGDADGNFNARGDMSLSVRQDFQTAGNVNVGGSFGLNAGGNALFGGSFTTGHDLDVRARGDIGVTGSITAGNSVVLDAGASVRLDGSARAGQDFIVNAGGNIDLAGAVAAGNDIRLTSGGDTQLGQSLVAGHDVSVQAGGNVTVSAPITAGNHVGLNAGGDLSVLDTIAAGGSVQAHAGQDMLLAGAVTAGANVTLDAGRHLTANDAIETGGSVRGTAGGNLVLAGPVTSAGDQDWAAGGDFTAARSLQGHNISVSGVNVSVAEMVLAKGMLDLTAQDKLQLPGELLANGNVTLNAGQGGIAAQNVYSNASVSAQSQGSVDLDEVQALGNVAIASMSGHVKALQVTAGQDLHITAADRIAVVDGVSAGGNAGIESTQSDVQLAQATAGKNLSVAGAQGVTVAGALKAGGDLTATSTEAGVTAEAFVAGGAATAQAHGDVLIASEVASGDEVNLASDAGKVSVGGDLYGANRVQVQAGEIDLARGLQSGGDASLTALSGDIRSQGDLVAMGGLTTSSTGSTAVQGDVQTAANLDMQTGGDLTVHGDVIAGQNLSLQAQGGVTAGVLASGADLTVKGHDIAVADIQALGSASLNADNSIVVQGSVVAGSIATQSTSGSTVMGGQIGTAGSLTMISGGDIRATDVVAGVANAQTARLSAAGSIQLSSLQTGGDYQASAGGDHSVSGEMIVQGHADVQAGRDILAGAVSAGNGLQAQAGRDITVSQDVAVSGDATLQSAGRQTYGGSLQVQGQLTAKADNGLGTTGPVIANDGIDIASSLGQVDVGGSLATLGLAQVSGAQAVLIRGDAQFNAGRITSSLGDIGIAGDLSAQGATTLAARGDVSFGGTTIAQGDLSASSSAGSITFNEELQVGGDFSGHADKDLNFLADSLLLGQTNLKADTGKIQNQGTMTFAQAVSIDTTGDLVNEGVIQSREGISINARNVDSNLQNEGGITTAGNLTVNATGKTQVGQTGTFSAAQDMDLGAAGGMSSGGTLQAGDTLTYTGGTLTNSGSLVATDAQINGNLTNPGKVYVQQDLSVSGSTNNSGEIGATTLQLASLGNSGKVGARSASLGSTSNSGELSANTIDISGGLGNSGAVSAGGSLTVGGGTTSDGSIGAGSVALNGGLTNSGQVQSSGSMSITGGTLRNTLQESKSCPIPTGCTTPDTYLYTQNPATISAGGKLDINVTSGANEGLISAGSITINGDLSNTRSANDPYTSGGADSGPHTGIIASAGDLTLKGGAVQNTGQIQSGGAVNITATGAFASTASSDDVKGSITGTSVTVNAGSIANDGLILGQTGRVDLRANGGAITNNGIVAAGGSLDLGTTGAVSNGAQGQLLGKNVVIQGSSFSNAGIVYGQDGPPLSIDIQTAGAFRNAGSGTVVAGSNLNIGAGSYSNAGGTVGSLGDATLKMAGNYAAASNDLVALNKLDLQVNGISVGVGESWSVGAADVSWGGKLTNYGSVAIAGNATGNIDNLSSGSAYHAGSPTPVVVKGVYEDGGNYPYELTDVTVIGYTDVANRAQLYIGGGLSGHLTNRASDVYGGGGFYDPQKVAQTITYEGKDSDGNIVQVERSAYSTARLYAGSGTTTITLTGPETGTIVGDGIIINGGDLTIRQAIDPATGLPLVQEARDKTVNPGAVEEGGTADTAEYHTGALKIEDPDAPGTTTVKGTDTSSAGAGAGNTGGAGDVSAQGPPTPETGTGTNSDPNAGTGSSAGSAPGGRNLNLNDPLLKTPQGAVAILAGANFNPVWPDWNQLNIVPGGISANDLQLNLSGQFTNHGQLDVTNNLIIDAAKGIDNFGASIKAGGLMVLQGANLNNQDGSIEAGSLYASIKGDVDNTRGTISAVKGGYLQADGNIAAVDGRFVSSAGKFVLDSGGNIDLVASNVIGKKGVDLYAEGSINIAAFKKEEKSESNETKFVTMKNYDMETGEVLSETTYQAGQVAKSSDKVTHTGSTIDGGDGSVTIAAKGDIGILGSSIKSAEDVKIQGRNVRVEALADTETTSSLDEQTRFVRSKTIETSSTVTHVGGDIKAGRDVSIVASEDLTTRGATIEAGQDAYLQGRNVTVEALIDKESTGAEQHRKNYDHALYQSKESIAGGEMTATGNIGIVANGDEADHHGDIMLRGAVLAADGNTTLLANRDITAGDLQTQHSSYEETYSKRSGFLSKKSTHSISQGESSISEASVILGKNVDIAAGRDVNVVGSHILADKDVTATAGRDVNIVAGQSTASGEDFSETRKSGLFKGGTFGITLGKSTTTSTHDSQSVKASGSSVQAQGGDATIVAGVNYKQIGSSVTAANDVNVTAKNIEITEAREYELDKFETRAKQSGLTIAVSSPVISAVQTATTLADAMGNTSDTRAQALGAASAGLYVYNNGKNIGNSAEALADGNVSSAGVTVSITVGSSKSESKQLQETESSAGSLIQAGRNVNLTATGAQDESNILVQGSEVKARNDATLIADNRVKLLASQDTQINRSSNSSSSAAVGVAVTYGESGLAAGILFSAGKGKGHENSDDTAYNNTHVTAGNNLTIQSGGDTTMRGAVASGDKVVADIGGDLNLESLQDSSTYDGRQKNMGGTLVIGYGVSGSASYSSSKAKGDYVSVTEQTGMRAGDEGFDITVKGNTDLKGAAIASTQTAVDGNLNSLTTGSLTTSDIENHSDYSASGFSLSGGFSFDGGEQGSKDKGNASGGKPSTVGNGTDWAWQNFDKTGVNGAAAGASSDKSSDSSTTHSAISSGSINITNEEAQSAKTGQSADEVVASIDRNVRTGDGANGLDKTWDGHALITEQGANAEIYAIFGEQSSTAWGKFSNEKFAEAIKATDKEAMECWAPDGACRASGHAVLGGVAGGVSGAAGAGLSSLVAPEVQAMLIEGGVSPEAAQAITVLGVIGAGAAVGGAQGGAGAVNEVTNNFVLSVPAIVETVVLGGATAIVACLSTPACVKAVSLLGDNAVANLMSVLTPEERAGIPGYAADGVEVGPNHTGHNNPQNPVEGTSTTTPTAGPREVQHTGGEQLDDKNRVDASIPGFGSGVQPSVDPNVYSSPRVPLVDGNFYHPDDGSIRNSSGQFVSPAGSPSPGTQAASDYADFLRSKGVIVVGEEVTVTGPVGSRRYDIVIDDGNGNLQGVEIKTGSANKRPYQDFTDRFVNNHGADTVGKYKGRKITSTITIFLD